MAMLSFTNRRKRAFCAWLLERLSTPLMLVDVGSGGPLKHPWTLLPASRVSKVDFDPEVAGAQERLPLCISNASGERPFHIACDPRGSSLHEPEGAFAARFAQPGILTARTIPVRCVTLDDHFAGRSAGLDLFDINVEGHDFQVLQGGERTFRESFVKLVKIEFELASVWRGQGWFADIDGWMRAHGFDLVDLDLDHLRPACVRRLHHKGEPVWGKALYVPGAAAWARHVASVDPDQRADDVLKAIAAYVAIDAPARALEALPHLPAGVLPDGAASLVRRVEDVFKFGRVDAVFGRLVAGARLLGGRFRS